jgi:serine/threonine protein kinase
MLQTTPPPIPEVARKPPSTLDMSACQPGELALGNFRLLEELGTGSFATAWMAQQEGTERRAVVKTAHPHLMRGKYSQLIASRFAAEFKAATRVQHPNLVTVFTAGNTASGLPAIAMEYIPGLLLKEILTQRAPLRAGQALRLLQQLVSVVSCLHEVQVIHRDISPTNVMVTRHPNTQRIHLKLMDFGIAKLDNQDGQTMGPLGTPRYLAPEQFFGQAYPSSDVYSLGAIFWWMLTGQEHLEEPLRQGVPFAQIMNQPFLRDPRELQPDIPTEVALLSRALLAHNPTDRPSPQELLERVPNLRRLVRDLEVGNGKP